MDSAILTALLPKAKKALRISEANTAFDDEITDILAAGAMDLQKTAGINLDSLHYGGEYFDPLLLRAILTYTRMQFGEPSDYDKLRESYWNQKAQLQSCSGYGLEGGYGQKQHD